MKQTIISDTFTTLTDCKKARKMVIENVCKELGVERKNARLPYDLIKLYGYNTYVNDWVFLTNYVYKYSEWLKNKNYSNYRIQTASYYSK